MGSKNENVERRVLMKISNINDLMRNAEKLPLVVLEDIVKRVTDWMASGGDIKDEYIQRQFRYAEKFI